MSMEILSQGMVVFFVYFTMSDKYKQIFKFVYDNKFQKYF